MKAKKYIWSMICVYMAYLTHGMQALIFSQNQVNFATKWGFDMTDPSSAAYAAGVCSSFHSNRMDWIGKFISVWIGGEISDRVGRKKLMIGGAILYIICFATMFVTNNATVAAIMGLFRWYCYIWFLGCIRISGSTGSISCSTRFRINYD